jgi:YD repeat-containing protein
MLDQLRRAAIRIVALALVPLAIFVPSGRGASVTYTYDPAGRLTTALYDNGLCVAYGYDAAGNRTSQNNMAAGAPQTPRWGTGVWGCFAWTP